MLRFMNASSIAIALLSIYFMYYRDNAGIQSSSGALQEARLAMLNDCRAQYGPLESTHQ